MLIVGSQCMCGAGSNWKISVPPFKFFCEPKTTQRKFSFINSPIPILKKWKRKEKNIYMGKRKHSVSGMISRK